MPTRQSATVRPLLSDMPGLRDTSVPASDRLHPWIKQQTFYTLPVGLWKAVIKELGSGRFKADDIALELRLSEVCEDHSVQVGFRDGQPILFNRLRTSSLRLSKPDCDEWRNKSDAAWRLCVRQLTARREYFVGVVRGYLGWLLTNPQFAEEYNALWRTCEEDFRLAIPRRFLGTHIGGKLPKRWESNHTEGGDVAARFCDFCTRWRLSHFVGPYLPQPLEPRLPNLLSSNPAEQVFLPDTIALEGNGLVREVLDDVLAQEDHLAEWRQLTKPDSLGRKSIHRFARLFELQHYCRALGARHPKALVGNREHLRIAVAEFFGTSPDSIRNDLRLVKRRFEDAPVEVLPAWLATV